MTSPTDPEEFHIADTPWAWLAIAAYNYVTADSLLLTLTRQLELTPDNPAVRAHHRQTSDRRREAYADLVERVATCEADRLAREAAKA